MERLPGLLAGEPVYWIEEVTDLGDGRLRIKLGFSDVTAHLYERLVTGTATMLAPLAGVEDVVHEDREVVSVVVRGRTAEEIADLVDRYWYEQLPGTPVDPEFETDPAELLADPWPAAPPAPRGVVPAPVHEDPDDEPSPDAGPRAPRTAEVPSLARTVTVLVFGVAALTWGVVRAVDPDESGFGAVWLIAVGLVNLVIAAQFVVQRRRATRR